MANGKLAGRVAVITGGSKGLGKAMAESLGRAGAKLALVARNATELSATAKELKAAGAEAEAFPADVTKEADVRRIEQAIEQRFGRVQILINNAATGNVIREGKAAQLAGVIERGALLGMQSLDQSLRSMVEAKLITGLEAYRKAVNKTEFERFCTEEELA